MSESIKIAVTGVGGGVGQSVIKSLYKSPYSLVGLDGESLGTGAFAVPQSYRIPYANSEDFIDALLAICEKEECRLIFPGLDAELRPLSLARDRFAAIGTTVVVSDPEVIEISDNKLVTYEKLTSYGIAVPVTMNLAIFIEKPVPVQFPLILKQQVGGARSKNVFIIRSADDLSQFLDRKDISFTDYVLQEYIEGDEYTCGSVNVGGECKGVIVMRRILRDGDTYKCFVEFNSRIEDEVRKVLTAIQPFGACNVQLRVKDGQPYIFEINARCSGTTASRTLCGFNEPLMVADYLLHGKEPIYNIKKMNILRYWNEMAIGDDLVDAFTKNGQLKQGDQFIPLWK